MTVRVDPVASQTTSAGAVRIITCLEQLDVIGKVLSGRIDPS